MFEIHSISEGEARENLPRLNVETAREKLILENRALQSESPRMLELDGWMPVGWAYSGDVFRGETDAYVVLFCANDGVTERWRTVTRSGIRHLALALKAAVAENARTVEMWAESDTGQCAAELGDPVSGHFADRFYG